MLVSATGVAGPGVWYQSPRVPSGGRVGHPEPAFRCSSPSVNIDSSHYLLHFLDRPFPLGYLVLIGEVLCTLNRFEAVFPISRSTKARTDG